MLGMVAKFVLAPELPDHYLVLSPGIAEMPTALWLLATTVSCNDMLLQEQHHRATSKLEG